MLAVSAAVAVQILAAAGNATSADCPANRGAVDASGCCKCFQGYEDDAAGSPCAACSPGYALDPTSGACSNGRLNSPCADDGAFPLFGCSVEGAAIGRCSQRHGRAVFPCVCKDAAGAPARCGQRAAEVAGKKGLACYPQGPRMVTTMPNEPRVGSPFSLTVVGCGATPRVLVLPFYDASLERETTCAEAPAVPQACRFDNAAKARPVLAGGEAGGGCHEGYLLEGLAAHPDDKPVGGLTEVTFPSVTHADKSAFRADERRARMFRICAPFEQLTQNGTAATWREVGSHDSLVSSRDSVLNVLAPEDVLDDRTVRGAGEQDSFYSLDGCCVGLSIGAFCLPLWSFLLLWILMCCLLAVLAYLLSKQRSAVEGEMNNRKYENFAVEDEDMPEMSATRRTDDL